MPKQEDTRLEKSAVTDGVIFQIRRRGGFALKYSPGPRFGKRGISDIIAIYRGIPLWIEAKRPSGGVVSVAQKVQINRVLAARGVAFVARSVDHVVQVLDMIDDAVDHKHSTEYFVSSLLSSGFVTMYEVEDELGSSL